MLAVSVDRHNVGSTVTESFSSHAKFSLEMTVAYFASFACLEVEGVLYEVLSSVLCGRTCYMRSYLAFCVVARVI
jgi:hypothetical protein